MWERVCVGVDFVMSGCVHVWVCRFCNAWVCVCVGVGFLICECVYVWMWVL